MKKIICLLSLTILIAVNAKDTEAAAIKTHTVEAGETLYRISTNHHITVEELKGLNGLDSETIHPGQQLTVATGDDTKQLNMKTLSQMIVGAISKMINEPEPKEAMATTEKTQASEPSRKKETVSKEFYVEATAYTAYCNGCSGITKTGQDLRRNPNMKVIAVDPKVIPLGTKVYVDGYGYAIAGDIGGAIKGNRIDVFIPTKNEAFKWGRKNVKIKILE